VRSALDDGPRHCARPHLVHDKHCDELVAILDSAMGSVHKQWTVVPSAGAASIICGVAREHIAGGQDAQPAALANRQFIVLLVLQHYLLSDIQSWQAWCLHGVCKLALTKHTIYCALVHDRQHAGLYHSAHRLSALCVMPLQHTLQVFCALRTCRPEWTHFVDERVQMSAQETAQTPGAYLQVVAP
jgi:hypothetical protein